MEVESTLYVYIINSRTLYFATEDDRSSIETCQTSCPFSYIDGFSDRTGDQYTPIQRAFPQ